MLGQYGLDINDLKSSHVLCSLPGMDIEVDLVQEYEVAERIATEVQRIKGSLKQTV
jgi:hypothetical protein